MNKNNKHYHTIIRNKAYAIALIVLGGFLGGSLAVEKINEKDKNETANNKGLIISGSLLLLGAYILYKERKNKNDR